MKINMKKLAAWILALLMVFQMIPAMATQETSEGYTPEYKSFREQLEITANPDIISVGETVTLSHTDGYDNLTWKSGKEEVATVENGVVTAIAPGTVKITAKEGDFSDAIIIRVIETPDTETGSTEKTKGEEEQDVESTEKMIVVITTAKEKLTYDGQEHEVGFTAKVINNNEEFNEENVKINPDKVVTAKDCGITKADYSAEDFTYEGTDNVIFEVSEGWIQIKPAEVTVTADDKEMMAGDPNPEFTASIVGLVNENDQIKIDEYETDAKAEAGEYNIFPIGEQSQNNYKVTFKPGKLTVNDMQTQPLYNMAKLGNDYYRLAKTTIRTDLVINKNYSKVLTPEEYRVDEYDFTDLTITTKDGNTYLYNCEKNADEIFKGANSYTVSLEKIEIIKNKIGCLDANKNPRWLIPEEQRYDDPNGTDSIHRNYIIHLTANKNKREEQPLYNMLKVNGSSDFYRLRKSSIIAKPAEVLSHGTVIRSADYKMNEYDFTDVVLVIDGEEYKYSPNVLTGEYESYFTVKLLDVKKEDRINGNADWFADSEGWQDGSYEQYGQNTDNNVMGYHANYEATLYKGTKPHTTVDESNLSVSITSDHPEGTTIYAGTKVTLTAHLSGFEDREYTLQWQHSTDGENWIDQEGANGMTFTFEMNDSTANYTWRVVATNIK